MLNNCDVKRSFDNSFEWTDRNIANQWGSAFVYYFLYLKFLIWFDLGLFILSWITMIPHFIHYFEGQRPLVSISLSPNATSIVFNNSSSLLNSTGTTLVSGYGYWLDALILSSYIQADFPSWYVFSALSMIAIGSMTWIYSRVAKHYTVEDPYAGQYKTQSHLQRAVDASIELDCFANPGSVYNLNETRILNKTKYTRAMRWFRNTISFLMFLGLVVIFSIVIYYTQFISTQLGSSNTLTSFVLAVTYSLVKAICSFFTQMLSFIELHSSETARQSWEGARLFGFRLFCYFSFYFIRDLGLSSSTNPSQDSICSSDAIGTQQLLLSMNYIYSDLFADLVLTYLLNAWNRWRNIRKVNCNHELKTEFRLDEQYAQVMFRQALLCGGLPFILGSPLSACLGHWMQLYADRYRLRKLTYVKYRVASPYLTTLHAYGVVFTLVLLFGYPKGFAWLWITSQTFFTCDSYKTDIT